MNPLWILLAGFGMLTLKGNAPFGGAPQGPATPPHPFDQNLPPDIAVAVSNCLTRCADPGQMLQIAGELARQNHPIAAIFLQTRAAMLIQARNQQQQQLPPTQVSGVAAAGQPTAAPQVQGSPQGVAPVPEVPRAVKNIQRTLTPEQNAKFNEFLEYEAKKVNGANGTAPRPEPSQPSGSIEVKERTA